MIPGRLLRAPGAALLALAVVASPRPASATAYSWKVANSSAWNNSANWTPAGIPGSGDDVTISISGTYTVNMNLNGGSATVRSLSITGSGAHSLQMIDATLTVTNGPFVVGAGHEIIMYQSHLTGSAALQISGDIAASSTGGGADNTITNAVTTVAGSRIRILGGSGVSLSIQNAFTVNGELDLRGTSAPGQPNDAVFYLLSGTLTIGSGGKLISSVDTGGGGRICHATINNQGTIQVDYPMTIDKLSADHVSTGTIDLNEGTLTWLQTGTTPSLTANGSITI
ncbi:MAG TPA: hypothetical protein VF720_01395, partial [Candidatus Eisenbacteria bacterium]